MFSLVCLEPRNINNTSLALNTPMLPKFRLTGHNAPLRAREEELTESHPGHNINIIDVVNYYIDNGVPRYITELISLCALVACKNICDSRTFKIKPQLTTGPSLFLACLSMGVALCWLTKTTTVCTVQLQEGLQRDRIQRRKG